VRPVGTPQFLAPEVWLGNDATERSDLYSLGATLYFMLTGRPPFQGRTVFELRDAHVKARPALPDAPPIVIDILSRCLEKKPDARPSTAKALYEDIGEAIGILTGDRRAPRRPERAKLATQAEGAYGAGNRVAADAAVLKLPFMARAKEKLDEALAAAPSILLVHGPQSNVLSRLVRNVSAEAAGARKFYVAARMVLAPSDAFATRIVEQLHLGTGAVPAWHDRIIAELQPEAGASPTLPSLMEIELRRALTPAEATDLIELGRRAEGKAIIFLVTCDDATARGLLHEIDASGFSFLASQVDIKGLTGAERAALVRVWTQVATGDRLKWTDDGIRFVQHLAGSTKSLDSYIHNAIMIAHAAAMKYVTSWCVLGADAHGKYLRTSGDVQPEWKQRPTFWPEANVLETLKRLRA
jgi:hypothetical protein